MLIRFTLLLSLLSVSAYAQEPVEKKEDQAAAIHQWADEVATKIEVTVGAEDQPATLSKQSLLRWSTSTSISGDIYGDCYIWTVDSRPVAFLSVYDVIRDVNRCLELQSLSPQPLAAKANDVTFWTPEKPGLQWSDLDVSAGKLANAEAAQRRLRTISSSFEGQIGEVNDTQKLRQLRLMSQPLYKYESDSKATVGALFAFVDSTDPEILLLLEVPLNSDAKVRYALVRQNHLRLVVNRGGEKIWELPQIAPPFPNPNVSDPRGIYFNFPWPAFVAKTGIDMPIKK